MKKMMRGMELVNSTQANEPAEQEPLNQDEMTLWNMVVVGVVCGIFACIIFTFCSEQWDYFITRKILGSEGTAARRRRQYLHNDERSSDLSDLVNEESENGSEDYSDDESSARVSVFRFQFSFVTVEYVFPSRILLFVVVIVITWDFVYYFAK